MSRPWARNDSATPAGWAVRAPFSGKPTTAACVPTGAGSVSSATGRETAGRAPGGWPRRLRIEETTARDRLPGRDDVHVRLPATTARSSRRGPVRRRTRLPRGSPSSPPTRAPCPPIPRPAPRCAGADGVGSTTDDVLGGVMAANAAGNASVERNAWARATTAGSGGSTASRVVSTAGRWIGPVSHPMDDCVKRPATSHAESSASRAPRRQRRRPRRPTPGEGAAWSRSPTSRARGRRSPRAWRRRG